MVKAFEVLGDVVALRGNISPSLLTTGKPEEVDAAVRHLADNVFHKGGKLILDARFRHSGRDAGRERARHVRGGAQIRQLTERAQRHADGPQQRSASRNRHDPVRRAGRFGSAGVFVAKPSIWSSAKSLLNAAYCYRIVPLDEPPSHVLRAGGETLDALRLVPESGQLTAVAVGICTLGPGLEQRTTALFAERRVSLALALDKLGNELLFALSRRVQDLIVAAARKATFDGGRRIARRRSRPAARSAGRRAAAGRRG